MKCLFTGTWKDQNVTMMSKPGLQLSHLKPMCDTSWTILRNKWGRQLNCFYKLLFFLTIFLPNRTQRTGQCDPDNPTSTIFPAFEKKIITHSAITSLCFLSCHQILRLWYFSPAAFQLGLVEGEINNLLRGIHQVHTPQRGASGENARVEEDGCLKQKDISAEDICPICQEVLLEKKLPVTFCRWWIDLWILKS